MELTSAPMEIPMESENLSQRTFCYFLCFQLVFQSILSHPFPTETIHLDHINLAPYMTMNYPVNPGHIVHFPLISDQAIQAPDGPFN